MKRPYYASSNAVRNVGFYERLAGVVAGPWLLLGGLRNRSFGGLGLALLGGTLLYRGATAHCPVYYRLGLSSADPKRGPIRVQKSIGIARPPAEVYAFFRKFENLPRFMKHLQEVRENDKRFSHWVANGPAGTSVEWDAELTQDQENTLISWRSLPGAQVTNSGTVRFEEAPAERGTIGHVELSYAPPAGPLGAAVAALFGEAPGQQIEGDLRRLRNIVEAGEIPTTAGQPSGQRSMLGALLEPSPAPSQPAPGAASSAAQATIDEASDESFPASDAPGWIGGTTEQEIDA